MKLIYEAEVSPIFKKDDSMSKSNYRLISVLASLSKLFEGLMCDQLLEHFHGKLSHILAAYRQGYSTQLVLMEVLEYWKAAIDKGENVGCVLMVLSKAFGALPHGLLLSKLKAYGLSNPSHELIQTYFNVRY